jgi:aspartate carbamoyltransferase regulatory subunit
MSETLSVSGIKNGSAIDHIPPGQALRIIQLLQLTKSKLKITVGMHLPSKKIGIKDLIKIENRTLTENEANEIVVFAPLATINLIENFKVVQKYKTHLPKLMKKVFNCPNPKCITQQEPISSIFYIDQQSKQVLLTCHYCEKVFERDQVKVRI